MTLQAMQLLKSVLGMVHAKNYDTVHICKSYAEKNRGLFFPDTVYTVPDP